MQNTHKKTKSNPKKTLDKLNQIDQGYKMRCKIQKQISTDYRIPVPVVASQVPIVAGPTSGFDPSIRRRLFAGFRPLSGFGRLRIKSAQHRSVSLPESNNPNKSRKLKANQIQRHVFPTPPMHHKPPPPPSPFIYLDVVVLPLSI